MYCGYARVGGCVGVGVEVQGAAGVNTELSCISLDWILSSSVIIKSEDSICRDSEDQEPITREGASN